MFEIALSASPEDEIHVGSTVITFVKKIEHGKVVIHVRSEDKVFHVKQCGTKRLLNNLRTAREVKRLLTDTKQDA